MCQVVNFLLNIMLFVQAVPNMCIWTNRTISKISSSVVTSGSLTLLLLLLYFKTSFTLFLLTQPKRPYNSNIKIHFSNSKNFSYTITYYLLTPICYSCPFQLCTVLFNLCCHSRLQSVNHKSPRSCPQ